MRDDIPHSPKTRGVVSVLKIENIAHTSLIGKMDTARSGEGGKQRRGRGVGICIMNWPLFRRRRARMGKAHTGGRIDIMTFNVVECHVTEQMWTT